MMWLVVGVGGLLFRTVQLFFVRDVQTGLVWMTKILTDPFHDVKLYCKAPLPPAARRAGRSATTTRRARTPESSVRCDESGGRSIPQDARRIVLLVSRRRSTTSRPRCIVVAAAHDAVGDRAAKSASV